MPSESVNLKRFFDNLPDAPLLDTSEYKIINYDVLEHIVNQMILKSEVGILDKMQSMLKEHMS